MDILLNPQHRYGPLPEIEQAQRMLKPHHHLHSPEGAMEYLEKHLDRVQEYHQELSSKDNSIWSVLQRLKTKKLFANTTKALRVIMVFHSQDRDLLKKMAVRLEEKLEQADDLADHYSYLLSLLAELGKA